MPQFSNPNQPDPSDPATSRFSTPDANLEAGLAALEHQKYDEAIAHLESVYQNAERKSVRLKAQMALVKAYEGNGEFHHALMRCQALLTSSNAAVRQWAEQAMGVLEKRHTHRPDDVRSKADHSLEDAVPDPRQQQLARSPFTTEASTLVDPLAIENGDENADAAIDPSPAFELGQAELNLAPPQPHLKPNPTGFIPFESGLDAPQELSNQPDPTPTLPTFDDVPRDPTGFVPAHESGALRESESTPSFNPTDPEDSQNPVDSEDPDDFAENPFSLLFEDGDESSAGAPQGEASLSTVSKNTDVDIVVDAGEEHDPPNSLDVERSPSPSESSSPAAASPVAAAAIDPELAASLTISKPRLGRGTSGLRRSTKPSSGVPLTTMSPERARQWKPLPATRRIEFGLSYAWTAIALVTLLSLLVRIALATANPLWWRIGRLVTLPRWYFLETHPTWVVIIALVVMLGTSQWVLQALLGRFYGAKPLPERELERRSPEAVRMMKRVCKQDGVPVPKLSVVPTQAPLILSYGLLPRASRIVVSQGALTQLNDEELAVLYAAELGHIRQRDGVLLMLVMVIVQIPFLLYRASATWGDRQRNAILRGLATVVASIAYGLVWMFRWPGLWLSRTRQYQGDRHAVSMTGNPNGLVLALTKVTTGIAQDIERQRSTDFLLSGMDLLLPISAQQALPFGSAYARHSTLSSDGAGQDDTPVSGANLLPFLLAWDVHNPHCRWLSINNSHPLLGDRIHTLNRYAQQFRLRPTIPLPPLSAIKSVDAPQPFWLQIAPYISAPIGMGLAIALWLVGAIADMANIDQLEWLWKDMSLLVGCIAMGVSFGILMRINRFFPDISVMQAKSDGHLTALLQDARTIPLNATPVAFEGRLLGRSGISNRLGQDLMLRTDRGTLKLHWMSPIGPLGNMILGNPHPTTLIGRSVTVTGWFRRGATPWIDVEKIRADGRTLTQSSHPLWSTLLAVVAMLWGAYVIYRGTL